ncbi:DUF3300 domain-containing protein [Rhodanobacter sp. BL-MT-08]
MPLARNAMYTLLCAGFVVMAGCNQPATPAQPPASSASAPAPAQTAAGAQQAAYTPPSADQLYQMVAPIALFPDKLVAQVLAGSTYPDQITAADGVVDQNPNLKGDALQTAIAQQPWDPSVKGLTVFPSVLDQMAKNIDWTTALGEAYVNDPTDVMNAIQVMRQRASSHGSLKTSSQLTVQTQSATPVDYATNGGQPVYSVVPAPSQVIEIQPTNPDTVYVPEYNPQVVYGGDVPYYPGYTYEQPRGYGGGDLIVAGAIGFGAAILVGSLFDHHHDRGYGWNNWGMNWGGHRGGGYGGGYGGGGRPAVIYNNNTYVSRSSTVINRNVTNNSYNRTVNTVNNNRNVGNAVVNNRPGVGPAGAMANGRPNGFGQRGAANAPDFGANAAQRGLHGEPGARGIAGNPGVARSNVAGAPHAPMSMPHFNGVPRPGVTTAQSERAAGHAAPDRFAHSNMPDMQHGVSTAQPDRGPMNRVGNAAQHPVAPIRGAAFSPQQHGNAGIQPHVPARPAEAQRFSQPQRASQPEHQAIAPRQMQRPMSPPRQPIEQPLQQAMHQPAAPHHPQAQHEGGHAVPHPAERHKDDKHH